MGSGLIKDQGYKPKVGEELIVRIPSYHRQPTATHRAKVVKVGREWVQFDDVPGLHDPKFRISSQHTENRSNYNAWYLTEEQYEAEQQAAEAREILKRYKATPDPWSPLYKDPEKLTLLARAVKKIMEGEEG